MQHTLTNTPTHLHTSHITGYPHRHKHTQGWFLYQVFRCISYEGLSLSLSVFFSHVCSEALHWLVIGDSLGIMPQISNILHREQFEREWWPEAYCKFHLHFRLLSCDPPGQIIHMHESLLLFISISGLCPMVSSSRHSCTLHLHVSKNLIDSGENIWHFLTQHELVDGGLPPVCTTWA